MVGWQFFIVVQEYGPGPAWLVEQFRSWSRSTAMLQDPEKLLKSSERERGRSRDSAGWYELL